VKNLTTAEKKKVRDAVVCAMKDLLAEDRLRDLVFDAIDGCANELCYNEEKCDALNAEVDSAMDALIAKIK
jgi:hypothetical protein